MKKTNPEEVINDNEEKNAIPEMVYKAAIVNCCLSLLDVEERLRISYYRRGGYYRQGEVIEFRVKLVKLFSLIKRMIREKGIEQEHIPLYNKMLDLETFKKEYEIGELITLKNFLLCYLHKLKITDLLIQGGGNFEEVFKKEYG